MQVTKLKSDQARSFFRTVPRVVREDWEPGSENAENILAMVRDILGGDPTKKRGNMRKGTQITNSAFFVAIVALSAYMFSPTIASPQISRKLKDTSSKLVTVLNPEIPNKVAERAPLIPRLDTVDGKTIWFVAQNWGDAKSTAIFFEELQKWFAKNHSTTKLVYKVKNGSFGVDDAALMKELVANADAAILGLAG